MTIPRSRTPQKRRRSLMRFVFTFTVTTAMITTGGFGTFPDNPITETFQEEIGQNIPENFLKPVNSYMENFSVPTIQPQLTSEPNFPLDLVGFLIGDVTSETPASVSEIDAGEETPALNGKPTEAGTETITATSSTQTAT